jgi:hypothetical protein
MALAGIFLFTTNPILAVGFSPASSKWYLEGGGKEGVL